MSTFRFPDRFDVIVVGAGHAGCEAGLAAARLGARTLVLTMNLDRVAHMACNCSIGGPAKAHIVREVDALGGRMAIAIDRTHTHIRMLNTSKGPAVQSLRAQADKRAYEAEMKSALEAQANLSLKQATVDEIVVGDSGVQGVLSSTGVVFHAPAVILATGTFLAAEIHIGHRSFPLGRAGDPAAQKLPHSLRSLGLQTGRLKTGTVPRIHQRSVDYGLCELQPSDRGGLHFSFITNPPPRDDLLPCHILWTNERTHRIVRDHLPDSALYGGKITGVGPRYCPSIEAKLVRFPDKDRHQVFLEREGWVTEELYVQGMSNSLPEMVQLEMLHSIPALAHAEMTRPGYAVEYDFCPPTQLDATLQSKAVPGLFMAGQINGTSGYEEAAGQGLVAGVNAVRWLRGQEPLILRRDQAYIGVLIDDLVTRGTDEPYRMMTSRAEFRLILRHGNADLRLTPIGRKLGLVDDARWEVFERRRAAIEQELERLEALTAPTGDQAEVWALEVGSAPVQPGTKAAQLLQRPEVTYDMLSRLIGGCGCPADVREEVATQIKYRGYIERQRQQAARLREMEDVTIPRNVDYRTIRGLKAEAQEKLNGIRPATLGAARRIPGISASDVSILALHLSAACRSRKYANVSRETFPHHQAVAGSPPAGEGTNANVSRET